MALVADRNAADRLQINEQLQQALSSRVLIEQAKGVLSQIGGLDMDDAFAVLRRYARDHNLRLGDLAGSRSSCPAGATPPRPHRREDRLSA